MSCREALGGREYPARPMVGVGALIMEDNRILLVKRRFEPGRGLWSIPGGLVELGEPVEEAVKREVREETGIEVELDGLLDVVDNIIFDEDGRVRFHYVLIDYLAHPVGGALSRSSREVVDLRWIEVNRVSRYRVTKTLKRLIDKINQRNGASHLSRTSHRDGAARMSYRDRAASS
ncbi:MAG: NUDIX hydrolase [Candidatus Bathyarchaeia archaeon]|nr:NUDIX hydrolase [Candidatus Bathyarchaeota archaeon]